MNNSKISAWIQVTANVGIVIGLLLVGVQLKQNSNLLKTQLLYEESKVAINLETQVIGENGAEVWAKSITDAKSLNLAEQRVMEALLWSFTEQLRATHMLAELGLLEDVEWKKRVKSESAFFMANEYGIAWWANYSDGNTALPEDLITAINTRLSEADNDFTDNYFKAVMDLINKHGANGN